MDQEIRRGGIKRGRTYKERKSRRDNERYKKGKRVKKKFAVLE